jgi:ABC-2 type transport system permease protein
LPQILLCGVLVPREEMADWLDTLAGALPLTYAYDALARTAAGDAFEGRLLLDVGVVAGCTALALALGAATLRRRTP